MKAIILQFNQQENGRQGLHNIILAQKNMEVFQLEDEFMSQKWP